MDWRLHRNDLHPADRRAAADAWRCGRSRSCSARHRGGRDLDAGERLEAARGSGARLCLRLSRHAAARPAVRHLLRPRFASGRPREPLLAVPARRLHLRGAVARALHRGLSGRDLPRRALLAVPHGQIEAARACGMSGLRCSGAIVFPIALRHALPAYSTEMISMMKATALVSLVTLWDVMSVALKIRNDTLVTYTPLHRRRGDLLSRQLRHRARVPGASSDVSRRICAPRPSLKERPMAAETPALDRRRPAQALRRARGAEGHLADGARRRRDLDPRLLGLGQEHVPALHQPARDAGRGRRDGRRRDDQDAPAARRDARSRPTGARSTASAPNSAWCSRASISGRT